MNRKYPTPESFWVEVLLVALAAACMVAAVLVHGDAIASEVEVTVTNNAVPGAPPATHIQVCTPMVCSVHVTPGLAPGATETFTFDLPGGTYPLATLQAAAPATNLNWSIPVSAPDMQPLVVPPDPCSADLTGDGQVTTADFGIFYAQFTDPQCSGNARD